jgi:CDP-glucose 4,6-dehydratase
MYEAGLLLLDNTKSKNLLGWTPKFNVDGAILKTFEWYRAFSD